MTKTKKSSEEHLNIAEIILSNFSHTRQSVEKLSANMQILSEKGLDKLNLRLKSSNRRKKTLEVLAEHNLAIYFLLSSDELLLSYEPKEFKNPPDFIIQIKETTFYIEVKRPSDIERENRKYNLLEKIQARAKCIKTSKCFTCKLSDAFDNKDVQNLMTFIKDKMPQTNKEHIYKVNNSALARLEFFEGEGDFLCLLIGGDLDTVNVSGLAKRQIKNTLCNAEKKFTKAQNDETINLIVMEVNGNENDIDICDALYGTEFDSESTTGQRSWGRKNDGLFEKEVFSDTVSGVIVRTRKNKNEIMCCDYLNILCVNKRTSELIINKIKGIIEIDKVFTDDMRASGWFSSI